MTLLDQFHSGHCEQIWQQIVQEQRPADDPEALAVATETVQRARDNLRRIYQKLIALDYEFAEPDNAFVTTCPEEAAGDIAAVEARFGTIPGLLRVWYSHIHSVNFAQSERQCRDRDHALCNLGWFPLAVYLPLAKCQELASSQHASYTEWHQKAAARQADDPSLSEYLSQCKTPDQMAGFLPLGSCASNNESKGFSLPCEVMDTQFFDDGEVTHFNEELRYVILSGTFRMLNRSHREMTPDFMKLGHPDPDWLLEHLTHDLQPI